jgi:hypothetical protein
MGNKRGNGTFPFLLQPPRVLKAFFIILLTKSVFQRIVVNG